MSSTDDRSGTTSDLAQSPEPGGASRTLIAVIAVALLAVLGLAALLALDPFRATTAPDATPSPIAAISPTPPVATDPQSPPATPPTSSPSPAPASPEEPESTPTAIPTDPQHELLRHVPEELRANCEPGAATPPALAVASCQADDGQILATYFLYENERTMNRAYDGFMEISGIEPDSGRCSEPATWPSEGSYSISAEPAGRVLCMQNADAPTIYWTDARLMILTWAFHLDADAERLYEFWLREAGPSP